jgi:hypothetical protein
MPTLASTLDNPPQDGARYSAHSIDGQLRVVSLGSSGRLEVGFLATVDGFGPRVWFVVATEDPISLRPEVRLSVGFTSAAYFSHPSPPPSGHLHDDARFYLLPQTRRVAHPSGV